MAAFEVYTLGGGDLLREVFNCIAIIFKTDSIKSINTIAFIFGGVVFAFQLILTRDTAQIFKFLIIYAVVTGTILIPKVSIQIIDQADDMKPISVDHVPFALAFFASSVSKIGAGVTEAIEDVFHNINDPNYKESGFVMGSKFIEASKQFEITDPNFSNNLNAFMQQCVFYDLLLDKYSLNDLISQSNPWDFLMKNTSVARAFPYQDPKSNERKILVCKDGAQHLNEDWNKELNNAAQVYGSQILGKSNSVSTFMSYLPLGFSLLTGASEDGESILKKSMLARSLQKSVTQFGANVNAPAALAAYEDAKTDLQMRHTLNLTGREAGYWLQQIKNILEATLYGLFILICFFMYLPSGLYIIRNYALGLLYLQSLSPLFAIVHFASMHFAQSRIHVIGSNLSMGTMAITTQVNADAMALSGYLSWLIALGGGLVIFRGLPQFMQSMGQYVGGVLQNIGSHVTAESVAGNISAGNTQFENHSLFNTNANHFDTNARVLSGHFISQTPEGGNFTITQSGKEVIDNQSSISNLGVSVHVADSLRNTFTTQAQTSYTSGINQLHASSEHYSEGFRKMLDFGHHQSDGTGSGDHFSVNDAMGQSKAVNTVNNVIKSTAAHLNISTEKAAAFLARAYVEAKAGANLGVIGGSVGVSEEGSYSQRMSENNLYEKAKRYAQDNHFSDAVDSAHRDLQEKHYRENQEQGARVSDSITSSFDQGDHYRLEAASSFSQAKSYSQMATQAQEQAATIDANYGQEFKEWLMDQPSMHGNGKMSRSMVESMSAFEKQSYAEKFSHEKASQMMHSFEQSHNLSSGQTGVYRDFEKNNKIQDAKLESIKSQNPYDNQVEKASAEHHFKPVDISAKNKVEADKLRLTKEMQERINSINKGEKEISNL